MESLEEDAPLNIATDMVFSDVLKGPFDDAG